MARRRSARKTYEEEPEEFTQADMFEDTPADAGDAEQRVIGDPGDRELYVSLGRQVRTLLITNVINKLDENKHRNPYWQPYDFRVLQLRTIRLVVDNMGLLDDGIRTGDVIERVADWAGKMAPDRTPAEHTEVAREVINWLLASDSADTFTPQFIEYDSEGALFWQTDFRVEILRAIQDPRGEIVLRASSEAINLLLHVLSEDIADAQRAEERLLNDYIEKGRYDLAMGQARRALLRSKQYAEETRQWLAAAQQDVSSLDLPAVRQKYDRALAHIKERLADEDEMSERIEKKSQEVPDSERLEVAVVEVRRLIRQCYDRHTTLHKLLLKVGPTLRREQENQLFARRVSIRTGMRDILLRMLQEPLTDLVAKDGFFRAVVGPVAPPVMEVWQLANDLIAAGREISVEISDFEEPDLVEGSAISRFPAEAALAARKALATSLAEPRRLSDLLEDARRFAPGCPELSAELTRLLVLQEYAPETREGEPTAGLLADFDGKPLCDSAYYGDDLLIGREEVVQSLMSTADEPERAAG